MSIRPLLEILKSIDIIPVIAAIDKAITVEQVKSITRAKTFYSLKKAITDIERIPKPGDCYVIKNNEDREVFYKILNRHVGSMQFIRVSCFPKYYSISTDTLYDSNINEWLSNVKMIDSRKFKSILLKATTPSSDIA